MDFDVTCRESKSQITDHTQQSFPLGVDIHSLLPTQVGQ